jgi:hypothetical protein
MPKIMKCFATAMLIVGVVAFAAGSAEASCRGGYYGSCGQWGGWGWGPWGPGVGWGQGNPYHYGSRCGWVHVRAWRNGQRITRRTWRCW